MDLNRVLYSASSPVSFTLLNLSREYRVGDKIKCPTDNCALRMNVIVIAYVTGTNMQVWRDL